VATWAVTLSERVLVPEDDRRIDISLLPRLVATGQKENGLLAILTEVCSISRPKVDPKFEDARPDAFGARKIPAFKPLDRHADARSGNAIQAFEPLVERHPACFGLLDDQFHGPGYHPKVNQS
jgi:hypothetical protein